MRTLPPSRPSLVVSPAAMTMSPPSSSEPVPTVMRMSPPCPAVALPVFRTNAPDEPKLAVPVVSAMEPLTPASPAFGVSSWNKPLDESCE